MAGNIDARILAGQADVISRSMEAWASMPVDQEMRDVTPFERERTTLAAPVSVSGPGTFFGGAQRTLTFEPAGRQGWWFKRNDRRDAMPIGVSVSNVWTTQRNIVLCSGSPHNYMRMVEHIIALRAGLGLDDVVISAGSGDPPLFNRGSMDLVEAVERAGIVPRGGPAPWVTVREPVVMGGPAGSFLKFIPAENGQRRLRVDCGIHFKTAIGRQRIRFDVTSSTFRHGALARTNTTLLMMLYCKTVGKIFADVRNLGYTRRNIVIAGRWGYVNQPGLVHEGKSLEAVWHRAALDLLAAVALVDRGRFAGTIVSYKAGHALDVAMVRALYENDLLVEV